MMMGVSKRQVLRYVTLPAIRPRLQTLFFSGFQYIPYFIALVYQTVKLLPANHPYLDANNIGRFGLRNVVAEAANHLTLKTRNIDQIILFVVILVGLVIAFVQIALVAISLFAQPVMAGVAMPSNFAGFFVTQAPAQDLAYMMLDMVFGVPNFFRSCVDPAVQVMCKDINNGDVANSAGAWILRDLGWPYPIHHALHAMFRVYSLGLLVVAVLITCYFIATVALETAQSGTPFGKRFNKLWAPLRIVVAFGLLIPLGTPGTGNAGSYGLNASQYIVLYAAKFGSSFATNGWIIFNDTLQASGAQALTGRAEELVSEPNPPEIGGILQFLYAASICAELEYMKQENPQFVSAYVVRDPNANPPHLLFAEIDGFHESYENIIEFIDGDSNIEIYFGVPDLDENGNYKDNGASRSKGKIRPVCGELVIPLSDPRPPGEAERGTEALQRYYVHAIQEIWSEVFYGNPPPGYGIPPVNYPHNMARYHYAGDTTVALPDDEYRSNLQQFYADDLRAVLRDPGVQGLAGIVNTGRGAIAEQIESGRWGTDPVYLSKGWAAAGLWYNRIAEMNGAITQATSAVPTPKRWPDIMEYVKDKKLQQDQNVPTTERFNPRLASNMEVPPREKYSPVFARTLWEGFDYWQRGDFAASTHTQPTGNIFMDAINAVFGTEGLFSMRKNANVHPLAQLTGIGRSLMESSVRNLAGAAIAATGGVVLSSFENFMGPLAFVGASGLLSIVTITMSAGFVLYYIVPFLPFIYFFFAVGGWIKAIFEAMVGAPLWALAHIRIDGNGLPGAAAVNGYFLIFEIFLRPILIVFGLLASISIFAALVSALNSVWTLVTANTSGFDVRSQVNGTGGVDWMEFFRTPLDEFFFTIIYAIIVYMMGMASFKLIDLVPANILRWMGQSVATENDAREDAAQTLVGTSSVGANTAISSLGGEMKGAIGMLSKGKAGG